MSGEPLFFPGWVRGTSAIDESVCVDLIYRAGHKEIIARGEAEGSGSKSLGPLLLSWVWKMANVALEKQGLGISPSGILFSFTKMPNGVIGTLRSTWLPVILSRKRAKEKVEVWKSQTRVYGPTLTVLFCLEWF